MLLCLNSKIGAVAFDDDKDDDGCCIASGGDGESENDYDENEWVMVDD